MVTRFTGLIVLALLFALSAASLYWVEQEVEALSADLDEIQRQIAADKEAIHVLKAEWAHLTQPERIADLSAKYLNLAPLEASQFMTEEQLSHIPAREQRAAAHYINTGEATP